MTRGTLALKEGCVSVQWGGIVSERRGGQLKANEPLTLGSRVVPAALVTTLPLGRFIAMFAERKARFRVSRGGRPVYLEDFYDELLKFEGVTSVTVQGEKRSFLGGSEHQVIVELYSTLNPLPGLAERNRALRRGTVGKGKKHSRRSIDFVFMDEVMPAMLKNVIRTYYSRLARLGEIYRLLSELDDRERRIAALGKEPIYVPLIKEEAGVRTSFEEVLAVTVPYPADDLELNERRAHWKAEIAKLREQYGFTAEQIQAARDHDFAVRGAKGKSMLVACFRLECETLPQFEYRFALASRKRKPVQERIGGQVLSFEEALERDDDPFA